MDLPNSGPFNADNLDAVIRARRSTMRVTERVVDDAVIDELCELCTRAPCHKHTWPWRFASLTGAARLKLGEAFALDMIDAGVGDEAKQAKTRAKYARTPNIVVVAAAPNEHRTFHDENRDAVAAGVQNMLLAATARGLATLWSTAPVIDGRRALELCGFGPTDRIIAVIYLGFAAQEVEAVPRPPAQVRHLR